MASVVNGELVDTWTVHDVQSSFPVSEEQALAVLEYVAKHYDANDGVNWDVLENAVKSLGYPLEGETEEDDE